MPETYQDYRGMTRWMLKKGGGLDMIYVGKDFSVECLSEHPGPDNIIYKDNPENDYLSAQSQRQQVILKKLEAVNHLLQAYAPDDALYKTALKEQRDFACSLSRPSKREPQSFIRRPVWRNCGLYQGGGDQVYENREDHVHYSMIL